MVVKRSENSFVGYEIMQQTRVPVRTIILLLILADMEDNSDTVPDKITKIKIPETGRIFWIMLYLLNLWHPIVPENYIQPVHGLVVLCISY